MKYVIFFLVEEKERRKENIKLCLYNCALDKWVDLEMKM